MQVQLRVCKYCLELKTKHQKLEKKRSSKTEGLIFSSPLVTERLNSNDPESPTVDILNEFTQVSYPIIFIKLLYHILLCIFILW